MASGSHFHFETMRTARLLMAAEGGVVFVAVALIPALVRAGGYGLVASLVLVVGSVWLGLLAFTHAHEAGVLFEYDTRRKFRAVCEEKHLAKMNIKTGRLFYPRLSQLVGGGESWSVVICPLLGQSLGDWEKAAPSFQMSFGVVNVRFVDLGGGRIRLTAGYRPMAPREFVPPVVASSGQSWRERLATVAVGVTEGGAPYGLPLLDSHTLVAGITGAGKGSLVWSVILGLEPGVRAGVVKLWGLDPKFMELRLGRGFFGDRYACEPLAMIELLERARDEMQQRADELGGQVRRFEPSERHPFNVVIIDELGYLSALLPDRKLRQRADEALSGILVLGRAVGFCVIGALQDPRKEVLSFRDLFVTRVAMRLPGPMVNLVLGAGAHEAGALCDLIPPGQAGAGVAFVLGEGQGTPLCVRMTWCSDDLIRTVAGALDDDGGSSPLPIGA